MLDVSIVTFAFLKLSPVLVQTLNFQTELLFSCEEALILLGEEVTSVRCYTLYADVFAICLAKEFDGLIVFSAELLVFTALLLLTGKLQCHEIFG